MWDGVSKNFEDGGFGFFPRLVSGEEFTVCAIDMELAEADLRCEAPLPEIHGVAGRNISPDDGAGTLSGYYSEIAYLEEDVLITLRKWQNQLAISKYSQTVWGNCF